MKKIIMALAGSGGLVLAVGCGGGADPAAPAPTPTASKATSSKPTVSPTPVELARANIGQQVQAALKKRGTYRMTITWQYEQDENLTATVKFTGAGEDFSLSGADGSVIGVGGQYFYKDGPLSSKAKWTKYDPKAKGHQAVTTNGLIVLYRKLVQSPRLLDGAPYSSQFAVSPGPYVGEVLTTRYVMLIDLRKAAADNKVYGPFLSAKEAEAQKTLPLSALLDSNGLLRELNYGTGENAFSIRFDNFGTKAVITPPAKQQLTK
ncbi:hypothetical protein [Kribbella voronezhensis]|uniref:hypothetical protein n=1 Tax=Kribbella voronezhensis TaxID=2512212 RepID=UPI001063E0F6|nr:hypothetical protein [Kribbella voronezhensis]